jgi:tetratricopeptide (TPR) repeat protein
VPAWLHRGIARLKQGHVEEGIADLTKGLEYSPDNAQLLLNRSKAYRRQKMDEQADRDLLAVKETRNRSAASLCSRAKVLKDSDPQQALRDLEEAYRLEPDRIGVLPEQARVYSTKLDDPETAIEILNRAVVVDLDTETAMIDRAVVLAQVGRFDDAEDDIKEALQEPNSARSLYQAACASALMPGERYRVRALSYLARAINAGYKADKLEKDPDLEPIRHMDGFGAIQRTYYLANLGRRQQNLSSSDAKR